jgi:hypothetical protein
VYKGRENQNGKLSRSSFHQSGYQQQRRLPDKRGLDSNKKRNKVVDKRDWEVAMHKILRLRAMGSVCRQQAAYNPAQRRRFMGEAEYWEHLAEHELAVHFEECNAYRSRDLANVGTFPNPNDTRWETIGAA